MRLLTGDIGGTNARLVLYEAPDDVESLRDVKRIPSHRVISQMYYKNDDFQSFTEVLCSFLAIPSNNNVKIHSCCLAVAGPVSNNHINFTNREGWIIDGNAIKEDFNVDSVVLVNDFVANGYGLLSLTNQELRTLQKGSSDSSHAETAPIALVGAGTGLGECFLTKSKDGVSTVFPTEGGHVEFAPRTNLESKLLSFLQRRLDTETPKKYSDMDPSPRVSVERLVSGKGLENIYEFLREMYPEEVDEKFDADYNESNERGRLIGAQKYNYKLFKKALEIMFAIYGGEVGNVALKYLPYGGIFVAGGIAPKNVEFITSKESQFMPRFLDKGRVSSIVADIPVYVVMKEDLGLRGAHSVASWHGADLLEANLETAKVVPAAVENITREAGLSFGVALRDAVRAYPATYAVVASATSALTAAACLGGLLVLRRMNKI